MAHSDPFMPPPPRRGIDVADTAPPTYLSLARASYPNDDGKADDIEPMPTWGFEDENDERKREDHAFVRGMLLAFALSGAAALLVFGVVWASEISAPAPVAAKVTT